MVQGDKINEVIVGGVTVSVWRAEDPSQNHHDDFKVEIGKPTWNSLLGLRGWRYRP